MRASRLIPLVLALALLGLVPATPTSTAAGPPAPRAGAADVPPDGYRITSRVVERTVKIKGEKRRKLFLVGRVKPRQGPVIIERAVTCNREPFRCNFKRYDKRLLRQGKYKSRITSSKTRRSHVWRVRVRQSYSEIWSTCVKEPCKLPFRDKRNGDPR